MRPRRCVFLTIPLLLVACERQPVAPDRVVAPTFAATTTATRGEVTGTIDFVDDPADCTANSKIGEILLFTGRLTYVERTTTASSGNVGVAVSFAYDPAVHLVGQTSGTVWVIDLALTHPFPSHDDIHGVGESYENVDNEYYTNANGDRLHLRANEHVTVNANGTVTVTRPFVWDCIGG